MGTPRNPRPYALGWRVPKGRILGIVGDWTGGAPFLYADELEGPGDHTVAARARQSGGRLGTIHRIGSAPSRHTLRSETVTTQPGGVVMGRRVPR